MLLTLYIQRSAILFIFSKKKRRKKKYSDSKFIFRDRIAIDKQLEREKRAKVENNPVERIKI